MSTACSENASDGMKSDQNVSKMKVERKCGNDLMVRIGRSPKMIVAKKARPHAMFEVSVRYAVFTSGQI